MALPKSLKNLVEEKLNKYCQKKFPPKIQNQVRGSFRIKGNNVTLYEKRIGFLPPHDWCEIPIAQFRYDTKEKKWTLYQSDRGSRWFIYLDVDSTSDIDELLKEVDRDPTGIFWG